MNLINTPKGKKQFIRDHCDLIRDELLAKVHLMPDNWDGQELRVYIADRFEEAASMSVLRALNRPRRRWRDYQNTIATTTL